MKLRCVTCGRFLGANTALLVIQTNANTGWQTYAPGPYDSRCAAKVPKVIGGKA